MTKKTLERLNKKIMATRNKVASLLEEIKELEENEKCIGEQYGLIRMKDDVTAALSHLDYASCEFE
jgi:septal ring factor EnvC (AmiA/AmiB activator)